MKKSELEAVKFKGGSMKKVKAKSLSLSFIWGLRAKMRAEGAKMRAEGAKMRAEGSKMRAEGDKMWAEAVIEIYGNIKLEWKNYDNAKNDCECHLETGEIFKPL